MLSGLYIISNSGIPLYHQNELNFMFGEGNTDNDILFSGLITAVQKFLVEIHVGEAKSFMTDNYNLNIYSEDHFAYVFIVDKKSSISSLGTLHKRLNAQIKPLLQDNENLDLISNNIRSLIKLGVSKVLSEWIKEEEESSASKKAKESLW